MLYGRVTIDYQGRWSGCSETPTKSEDPYVYDSLAELVSSKELIDKRSSLHKPCESCEFLFQCGSMCYYKENTKARCRWRIYNHLEALYYAFVDKDDEFIQKAIENNHKIFLPTISKVS